MKLLARSAMDGNLPQEYSNHISGVIKICSEILKNLEPQMPSDTFRTLEVVTLLAARFHDLGKLCYYSQLVLNGTISGKMPNHVQAGTMHLLSMKRKECKLAAFVVDGHHKGMRSISDFDHNYVQLLSQRCPYVSDHEESMTSYVNRQMSLILEREKEAIGDLSLPSINLDGILDSTEIVQLSMSILCYSDHLDAYLYCGGTPPKKNTDPRWDERILRLKSIIDRLQSKNCSRNPVRMKLFEDSSKIASKFGYCSAAVGSGKTCAVINHAMKGDPLSIIIVSPYILITEQSASVARQLVLEDESESEVVGEFHSRLPKIGNFFDRMWLKEYGKPFNCMTTVEFIETLCSRSGMRLKKLHKFIGSHIIIDECHTIRLGLWPLLLKRLTFLVDSMNCKVTFVSGTMSKPWKHKRITDLFKMTHEVEPIVSEEFMKMSYEQEKRRLEIIRNRGKLTVNKVCDLAENLNGSKILVFNTIKNAALVAKELASRHGRENVFHISTALTPNDLQKTYLKVKSRLESSEESDSWFLVATSCVDSGLDISFRNGMRELNSVDSIIQTGGRINRGFEFCDSKLVVFETDQSEFTSHKDFAIDARITSDLWGRHELTSELSEKAMNQKLKYELYIGEGDDKVPVSDLMRWDRQKDFEKVEKYTQIIPEGKISVLINPTLSRMSFSEISRNSVQIHENKLESLPVDMNHSIGVPVWIGGYNEFIGWFSHFLD